MTEQVFSHLISFEETVPEEIVCKPTWQNSFIHETDSSFTVYYNDYPHVYPKSKFAQVVIKRNGIKLFRNKYFCNISKSIVEEKDLFSTTKGYALNKHNVKFDQHLHFTLKPVYYINIPTKYSRHNRHSFSFVFNIADMREIYADLHNNLLKSLPFEIVLEILKYQNIEKKGDGLFQVTDFPFDFSQEFQGKIPDILSKLQLKKLFEIGAIKLAVSYWVKHSNIVLSDQSYDHVYPGNFPNALHSIFKSKEEMHEVKDAFLEDFFDD